MPKSREIPVENRGTKSQDRVGQSVLTKVGGWTSPTLLAPRRRPMSQVSLPLSVGTPDLQRALSAPKWRCGQPSVRRGTERSQRQGSTSGAVVNGRPMLLVLIQVRAALAHLGLLGGALNLGPLVEVRPGPHICVPHGGRLPKPMRWGDRPVRDRAGPRLHHHRPGPKIVNEPKISCGVGP